MKFRHAPINGFRLGGSFPWLPVPPAIPPPTAVAAATYARYLHTSLENHGMSAYSGLRKCLRCKVFRACNNPRTVALAESRPAYRKTCMVDRITAGYRGPSAQASVGSQVGPFSELNPERLRRAWKEG